MIDERSKIKGKILNVKSQRILEQLEGTYSSKDKEVKRSARNDKRNYINSKAAEAEAAVARGETNTVYKITKELC